jgi:hypothetical protein
MTSLTPVSDAFEEGIAKMQADLGKQLGDPAYNQIGIRISLAVMPPFLRAVAKEADQGANPEVLMGSLSQVFSNMIVTVVSSAGEDEDLHAGLTTFLQSLMLEVLRRSDPTAMPADSIFSKEIDTSGGRA